MFLKILYWLAVVAISVRSGDRPDPVVRVAGRLRISRARPALIAAHAALPDARRPAPHEPREHDDPLRRAVERVAGAQDEPLVAHLGPAPTGPGRRRSSCCSHPVDEAPVRHVDGDPLAAAAAGRCAGTGRRRWCGGPRSPSCRGRRAAASRDSGRAPCGGCRRRCPPRRTRTRRSLGIVIRAIASPFSGMRADRPAAGGSKNAFFSCPAPGSRRTRRPAPATAGSPRRRR